MSMMIVVALDRCLPVSVAGDMRCLTGRGGFDVEMLRFRHRRDQECARRNSGREKPESRKKRR